MAKKEYKIGEVFQFGLVKLRCESETDRCEGCFLNDITSYQKDCKKLIGECEFIHREDDTDVIFVKVEE